jgi:hypothetical protein
MSNHGFLLRLVGWYLWETRKMRKAAENQVIKSQELVDAAQRQLAAGQQQVEASLKQLSALRDQVDASREQVAAAQDQLEVQIKPAVVARVTDYGIEVLNIGNGPALHVKMSGVERHSHANWGSLPCSTIASHFLWSEMLIKVECSSVRIRVFKAIPASAAIACNASTRAFLGAPTPP